MSLALYCVKNNSFAACETKTLVIVGLTIIAGCEGKPIVVAVVGNSCVIPWPCNTADNMPYAVHAKHTHLNGAN